MYEMNDAEKVERAQQKALHAAVRACPPSRYRNLAWGYIRGFKFRRIERTHHIQRIGDVPSPGVAYMAMNPGYVIKADGLYYEHNMPNLDVLKAVIQDFIPDVKIADVNAWLRDPEGAIPVPAPRPKRVYKRVAGEWAPLESHQAEITIDDIMAEPEEVVVVTEKSGSV